MEEYAVPVTQLEEESRSCIQVTREARQRKREIGTERCRTFSTVELSIMHTVCQGSWVFESIAHNGQNHLGTVPARSDATLAQSVVQRDGKQDRSDGGTKDREAWEGRVAGGNFQGEGSEAGEGPEKRG